MEWASAGQEGHCTASTTRPWRIRSVHTSASAIPCPAKKQGARSLGGASAYRQTVRISVDQTACPAILHLSMLMEPPKLRVAARTEEGKCLRLTIPSACTGLRGLGDVPPQRALVRGENPASPRAMSRHARSLVSSRSAVARRSGRSRARAARSFPRRGPGWEP